MPEQYICEEIEHGGDTHKLHEITLPSYNEPKWYTTVIAYDAFRSGARAGASAVDKEFHRDRCCWGPKSLYILKRKSEWLEEQERIDRSHQKFGGEGQLIGYYEGADNPDVKTRDDLPRTLHSSLEAFFAHISFDRKTRRYRAKDGKPIKYSVLDPAKVRRVITPNTTPT